MTEQEKSASAFARIEKYREARKELERKLDTHYQRKM
jgi:nucleoporin GLE1